MAKNNKNGNSPICVIIFIVFKDLKLRHYILYVLTHITHIYLIKAYLSLFTDDSYIF